MLGPTLGGRPCMGPRLRRERGWHGRSGQREGRGDGSRNSPPVAAGFGKLARTNNRQKGFPCRSCGLAVRGPRPKDAFTGCQSPQTSPNEYPPKRRPTPFLSACRLGARCSQTNAGGRMYLLGLTGSDEDIWPFARIEGPSRQRQTVQAGIAPGAPSRRSTAFARGRSSIAPIDWPRSGTTQQRDV